MKNSISAPNLAVMNYLPSPDNSPKKADVPLPPMHNRSSIAERRVHVQGSAAWLSQKVLKNNQTGDQPSLHRTLSAPHTPTATDTPRVANGFPEWSAQRMRKAPDLDEMYGSAQPPRAKPGKASGIQKQERNEKDGMVIVHPGRIILKPVATPELSAPLKEIRDELHAHLKASHDARLEKFRKKFPAIMEEGDDKFLASMEEDYDKFLASAGIDPGKFIASMEEDHDKFLASAGIDHDKFLASAGIDHDKFLASAGIDYDKFLASVGIDPDKFLPRLGESEDKFQARLKDFILMELREGAVYKWNEAKNGQLMLGKSKYPKDNDYPEGRKLGLGHPTLVGGLKEPEARMGGELRLRTLGKDDLESVFDLNNDSGRYGEYEDRTPKMLRNVANHISKAFGIPVKEEWKDKSKVALKNPKVAAED